MHTPNRGRSGRCAMGEMRCANCGTMYEKGLSHCPNCGMSWKRSIGAGFALALLVCLAVPGVGLGGCGLLYLAPGVSRGDYETTRTALVLILVGAALILLPLLLFLNVRKP